MRFDNKLVDILLKIYYNTTVEVYHGDKVMNYVNFRKTWEAKFGTIPKDHELLFRDTNHLNCNFDNLYYGIKINGN